MFSASRTGRQDLEALLAQLQLQLHPDRNLGTGRRVALPRLVDGVDGREPHGPRSFARRDLDCQRVHAAHRPVERNRPEDLGPRHRGAHDRGPLGRRAVMRLEHEAGDAKLSAASGEREVVDLARYDIGRDVDMSVKPVPDDCARVTRRFGTRRRSACATLAQVSAQVAVSVVDRGQSML